MSSNPVGGDVQILVDGSQLLVDGAPSDIDALLERLSISDDTSPRAVATGAVELGALAATVGAVASTTRELYELTPAAQALIAEFSSVATADGAMAGVVRRGGSSIAGHLSFDQVSMGAEQAVALQSAAMAMALRSAIADVKKAVEEVDGKVEDLQQRARAQEIGEVVGLFRDLDHMVGRTQRRGHLLEADWDSVGSARRDLVIALERLRAYVTSTLKATVEADDLPRRVKAVQQMSSGQSVDGALQLIAVAEHALHLWHYLYVERVRTTEPEHVSDVIDSARSVLDDNRRRDEAVAALVNDKLAELGDVRPLEIHRRRSITEMDRAMTSAKESLAIFVDRTRITLPGADVNPALRPGVAEARAEVKARAVEARNLGVDVSRDLARSAQTRAGQRIDKIRHRRNESDRGKS